MKFAVEIFDDFTQMWGIISTASSVENATAIASDHALATAAPKRIRIRDTIANRVVDEWFVIARESKTGESGKPFRNAIGELVRLTFDWYDIH